MHLERRNLPRCLGSTKIISQIALLRYRMLHPARVQTTCHRNRKSNMDWTMCACRHLLLSVGHLTFGINLFMMSITCCVLSVQHVNWGLTLSSCSWTKCSRISSTMSAELLLLHDDKGTLRCLAKTIVWV